MNDNELKKLNRKELLEVLLQQLEENEILEQRIKTLEKELESRDINLTKAGSIAEAALRINDVFTIAQAAADQYIENVKRLYSSQDAVSDAVQSEEREKAAAMLAETEKRCREREKAADEYVARAIEVLKKMRGTCKEYSSVMNKSAVIKDEKKNQ